MLRKGCLLLVAALVPLLAVETIVVAAGPADTGKASKSHAPRQRVSCEEVINKVDHDKSVQEGHALSVYAVAKALGTPPAWVEQCMMAYGRRLPRKVQEGSGESASEERIERFEEQEAEESFPEDVEESDDKGDVEARDEKPAKLERPTPKARDEVQKEFEEQFNVY